MPLRVEHNFPKLNIDRTLDEWHTYATLYVLGTVRRYVTAVTDVIPIWSGGTKASFLKLANQAEVTLGAIAPVPGAPNRVDLGIAESKSEVWTERGERYGFSWESELYYIHFVDALVVPFMDVGEAAIARQVPFELPPPIYA